MTGEAIAVGLEALERAARALWERDARRSIGRRPLIVERVWPRVADEYRAQARTALEAAGVDVARESNVDAIARLFDVPAEHLDAPTR